MPVAQTSDPSFMTPRQEFRKSAVLFLYFFIVICAFWIQKPLRTSKFLTAVGPEHLPLVKFMTSLLLFPLAAGLISLARKVSRHALFLAVNGFFLLMSVAFWYFFHAIQSPPAWSHYFFFCYVDIFNTFLVTLFWSVASDLCSPGEARRIFGFVGTGGILGGAAGSALTGWTAGMLRPEHLLLICAGLMAVLMTLGQALPDVRPHQEKKTPVTSNGTSIFEGLNLIRKSHFLLAIAGIVGFYELVSVIVDYQFNTAAAGFFKEEQALTAFLGKFSSASIVLAGLFQFFGTTFILRRWGPRLGLLVLPTLFFLGLSIFLIFPVFPVLAFVFGSDAVFHYSVNQSSKEALYSATGPKIKYEAKAYIDMFFFRLAKGAAAGIVWLSNLVFLSMGWGLRPLTWICLAALAFWIHSAYNAGREFSRKEESAARPHAQPLAAAAG